MIKALSQQKKQQRFRIINTTYVFIAQIMINHELIQRNDRHFSLYNIREMVMLLNTYLAFYTQKPRESWIIFIAAIFFGCILFINIIYFLAELLFSGHVAVFLILLFFCTETWDYGVGVGVLGGGGGMSGGGLGGVCGVARHTLYV